MRTHTHTHHIIIIIILLHTRINIIIFRVHRFNNSGDEQRYRAWVDKNNLKKVTCGNRLGKLCSYSLSSYNNNNIIPSGILSKKNRKENPLMTVVVTVHTLPIQAITVVSWYARRNYNIFVYNKLLI